MGIRVHKMIGYGVANLKYRRNKKGHVVMTDPRIDWDAYDKMVDSRYDRDMEKFIGWMEQHSAEIDALAAKERPTRTDPYEYTKWEVATLTGVLKDSPRRHHYDFLRCIQHGTEYMLPRVMLFIAPTMADQWYRYDDTLDWVEESHSRRQNNWVQKLRSPGIYPYSGTWIRFRDPEQSFRGVVPQAEVGLGHDEKGPLMLDASDYAILVGTWDRKQPALASGEFLEHLKKDFRPPIPTLILALILWSGCVKDVPSFLNDLRPHMYVYWG
jgi:hypothetical protein